MDFSGFNWPEVALAALSAFALGVLWYGPLFGKRWQALNQLSNEQVRGANMKLIFAAAFLLNLFLALFVSLFIEVVMMMGSGAATGAAFGVFLGLIFVAPTFGVNYLFARRPLQLYLIDVGYQVLQLALMGAVMGAWA
jgi:hypothetical protein